MGNSGGGVIFGVCLTLFVIVMYALSHYGKVIKARQEKANEAAHTAKIADIVDAGGAKGE